MSVQSSSSQRSSLPLSTLMPLSQGFVGLVVLSALLAVAGQWIYSGHPYHRVRDAIDQQLLSSGVGTCETLDERRFTRLRTGTALRSGAGLVYAKPIQTLTGTLEVTCAMGLGVNRERQTHWFIMSRDSESGTPEYSIRLGTRAQIENALTHRVFTPAE